MLHRLKLLFPLPLLLRDVGDGAAYGGGVRAPRPTTSQEASIEFVGVDVGIDPYNIAGNLR